MFTIGELLIYSRHGICRVDDICEKTIGEETKMYYVLHPLEEHQHLSISIPVDNDKITMLRLLNREQAEELLESFRDEGYEWIENPQRRFRRYSEVMNSGNREKIAQVVNTLLRKRKESEQIGKKMYDQDRKLLDDALPILFRELAISLDTTNETIQRRVSGFLEETPV